MKTYNCDLMVALWDIFPGAFDVSKVSPVVEYRPGRFGVEEITTGTEIINLAACILNTANATMIKYGLDSALEYIRSYKPEKVQRNEIACFLEP